MEKKKPLYERLKVADSLNEQLEERINSFNQLLQSCENYPNYENAQVKKVPEIDVTQIQRSIIEEYRDNVFLEQALTGRKSLVDRTKEVLGYKYKTSINWIWPKKHKENDRKVEELNELICCEISRANFDDIYLFPGLSIFMGVAAMGMYAIYAIEPIGKDPGPLIAAVVFASFSVFLGAMTPWAVNIDKEIFLKQKFAETAYLDKKLDELYGKS